MAFGLVGTPLLIAAGGSYTPEAGSNRLVVFVAANKGGTALTLTNIVYNGVTRTPTVTVGDTTENRVGVGICVFKESELPAGSATVTPTWSESQPSRIVCYTIQDAPQTSYVRASGSAIGVAADGVGVTGVSLTGLTAGDLCIGGWALRQLIASTQQNSWTEDADGTVDSGGNNGSYSAAHHTAGGTSDTYSVAPSGADSSYAMAAVAIAQSTGGDTTAPVLTLPTGTSTGTSTATVGATTDEGNGTLYAVVTTSATQPSVAQIKAGQNHTGAAATWSGSLAISSTGAKTLSATGLSQGTTYYAHLVHNDASNNDSNRVVSASFTTSAVTITDAGDETFQPGESITISGTTFGASQGSGKVYISPTDSIADGSKVEQTVTSWGASSITITVAKGALPYGAAYLFVQENGGVSNAAGYAVSFITRGAQRSMLLGIG